MTRNLHISAERLGSDLDAMARITEPDRPWTRRAFSPLFDEGRRWLKTRFEEAGLACTTDAGGNLVGLMDGSDSDAGTIMIGSHSDSVPNGGRFDGIAGVLVALEVARSLKERGIRLKHSLAVADFLAEEVSIFGLSCIGSRGMAGVMPADWLDRENDGRDLRQALLDVGGEPAGLDGPLRQDLKAFLELHIEQGPVLEQEGIDIGVVTAIVGITRIEVIVTGRADHAGTTPMDRRADALTAAAALVGDINRTACEMARSTGRHFTATVGEFDIEPNAANVVPGRVRMLIDARAEDKGDMEAFIGTLADHSAMSDGSIRFEHRVLSDNPAVAMDKKVADALAGAAQSLGVSHRTMVSGAGHDAAFMARLCPAAMIFVPCLEGRSHCPEEWADLSDLAIGAEVMAEAVIALDTSNLENEVCVGS